ncbi:MAG TPA: hypothetical protein VJ756_15815 [Terriglobales bacterium]|nr:hypothetical protein [Terriglobales bacterium]
MKIARTGTLFIAASSLLVAPAWARVFLRWTQSVVPAVEVLGVNGLAIPWNANATQMGERARRLGYDVYLEVGLQQAPEAAAAAQAFSGIMLDPGGATRVEAEKAGANLRRQHPGLSILVVDHSAKQPQMRGHSIVSRQGVLQITSPTEQPWLDCNLALVGYDRLLHPEQAPLYQFDWELSEPLQQQEGPTVDDYELAISEAGAFHADLILNLPEDLQTRLADVEPRGMALWAKVKPYLRFVQSDSEQLQPQADVGVVADGDYNWFEPANLMARHNIPFRVLSPAQLNGAALHNLDLLVAFAMPDNYAVAAVGQFASDGGTAVVVDVKGNYAWHSAKPIRKNDRMVEYAVGKGKVIELLNAVDDPDAFASDIRRLLDRRTILLSLWNALTTIAVPYSKPGSAEMLVEMVNYAQDPMTVQVQVKGNFGSVRYQSPGTGCCQQLKPFRENGFTQFVVPRLVVAGRIYLTAAPAVEEGITARPKP